MAGSERILKKKKKNCTEWATVRQYTMGSFVPLQLDQSPATGRAKQTAVVSVCLRRSRDSLDLHSRNTLGEKLPRGVGEVRGRFSLCRSLRRSLEEGTRKEGRQKKKQ